MRGVYSYVVKPKGERYSNVKKIGDKELILNAEISNHEYINREAIVTAVPMAYDTGIKVGDTVLIHHNVFRRWYNIRKEEKNSGSYFSEDTYVIFEEQIFAYKSDGAWQPLRGYCFVQPLRETNELFNEKEKSKGIVLVSDGTVELGSLVEFKPSSKFEFIIEGDRVYRVRSNKITIKYEHQGNEEKYNPSWAQSS
jgi:hypothetical protein|tara:strand:+ start:12469 stop:13056 length:588 start_codon:yes stop_codon:yes gene_type:complete